GVGGDPDRLRPAAGDAGDPEALRARVGAAAEVVGAAHAVPALDAGRRVAAGLPPPAAEVVGAVVLARDLAQLQRVHDQADVAVGGEPHAVVLERRLVAVAAAAGVAADVEDRRQPARRLPRPVEVAGDVQAGPALVVQLLDDDAVALHGAGDGGVQRRPLRQRPQAEHVQVLTPQPRPALLPLLLRLGTVEEAAAESLGLL